ncbi:DUF1192 domain-containing protein [Rhodoblastus sp.]|uniref:DUF1192 domain-containing protein n=1 Tax=Rhodoblastus sp. TaxID=1962975 RepID=UPI00260F40FA|nr:DUF1192 domain-containing protein [Rhodoblastus sp.]
MARDDDEFFAPKKPAASQHVLGEPLDSLSVEELGERIEMLRAEIVRLEEVRARKGQSRADADAVFRK